MKNKNLFLLLTIATFLKIPAVFMQEQFPYLFCDEEIFLKPAYSMLINGDWITSEFRSGGFNIYIPLIVAKLILPFNHLSYENFIILSRFISVIVFFNIGLVFLNKILRLLGFSNIVKITVMMLYLFSPVVLALSRIHYPDHYIVSFVFIAIYYSLQIRLRNRLTENFFLFITGSLFGILISIKYTAILILVPLGLLIFLKPQNRKNIFNVPLFLVSSLYLVLGFVISLLVFNFSAILNLDSFEHAWGSNYFNYRMDDPNSLLSALDNGIGFYVKVVFFQFFGFSSFILFILGNYFLLKKQNLFLVFILNFPVFFLIIYLGVFKLYINRNMLIVLPFYLLLLSYGLKYIDIRIQNTFAKIFFISILFFEPLLRSAIIVNDDYKKDSRILMETYISQNLKSGKVIGYSWNCFCSPPFNQSLYKGIQDEEVNVDYFLVDSWWSSERFLAKGEIYPDFFSFTNYRNFHFTHMNGGPKNQTKVNVDFHSRFHLVFQTNGSGPILSLYKKNI